MDNLERHDSGLLGEVIPILGIIILGIALGLFYFSVDSGLDYKETLMTFCILFKNIFIG